MLDPALPKGRDQPPPAFLLFPLLPLLRSRQEPQPDYLTLCLSIHTPVYSLYSDKSLSLISTQIGMMIVMHIGTLV